MQPGVKPVGELSRSLHFFSDPVIKKEKLIKKNQKFKQHFLLDPSNFGVSTNLKCSVSLGPLAPLALKTFQSVKISILNKICGWSN